MNTQQKELIEDAAEELSRLDDNQEEFICQMMARIESNDMRPLSKGQAFFLLQITEKLNE